MRHPKTQTPSTNPPPNLHQQQPTSGGTASATTHRRGQQWPKQVEAETHTPPPDQRSPEPHSPSATRWGRTLAPLPGHVAATAEPPNQQQQHTSDGGNSRDTGSNPGNQPRAQQYRHEGTTATQQAPDTQPQRRPSGATRHGHSQSLSQDHGPSQQPSQPAGATPQDAQQPPPWNGNSQAYATTEAAHDPTQPSGEAPKGQQPRRTNPHHHGRPQQGGGETHPRGTQGRPTLPQASRTAHSKQCAAATTTANSRSSSRARRR